MKIVIARLFGGLGNQLFIYAFNRVLSLKQDLPLKFDAITGFKRDRYKRKYALDYFKVKINKSNLYESSFFLLNKRSIFITKLFYPNSIYLSEINSEDFEINSIIDNKKKYFTEGYWQTYRYFEGYEQILRNDLAFDFVIPDEIKKIAERIENTESISIHFRRKEYAQLVDLTYYKQAISLIKNKSTKPKFYIFTDDVTWVKNNFLKNQNDIILINSNSQIFDFFLMSKCKSHIISNSTFAWWASWLSSSLNKIIIAPQSDKWPYNNILYRDMITL